MDSSSVSALKLARARILDAAATLGLAGTEPVELGHILQRLCTADASGAEISAAIERHPVLSARVLRVANSAYYGQVRATTTIQQATLLLGLDAVRGIAAAVCMSRALPRRAGSALNDMSALLRHSLATAIAAECLARATRPESAPVAFMAGLMHNLGVAIQACVDENGILAMLNARRSNREADMRSLEVQCASLPHEDCAAMVFESWNLPAPLVAAAAHHHRPWQAPAAHRQLTTFVHAGACLALTCGHTFSLEPAPTESAPELVQQLGLPAADGSAILSQLTARVAKLHGAITG